MSYDLTIQFDDEATTTTELLSIESFLQSYPGTQRVGRNQWNHEPNSSIHVEIDFGPDDDDDSDTTNSIGVRVPYGFLPASGEPALRLCFALADRLGWRVYDEQIGEYIDPTDMRELVAGQAQFADAANEVLAVEIWFDQWKTAVTQQSLLFMIIVIVIAAVAACAIILQLDVQEDKMSTYLFWIGLPIALAIFTIKITFDAWLKNRRKSRNHSN